MTHDLKTEEGLSTLEAICEAATEGPWDKPFDDGALMKPNGESLLGLDVDGMAIAWVPADAEFIATARTALPEALAEILRLRKKIADLESRPRVVVAETIKGTINM